MAEMIVTRKPTIMVKSQYLPWNGLRGLTVCRQGLGGGCVAPRSRLGGGFGDGGGRVLIASLVLLAGVGTVIALMSKS